MKKIFTKLLIIAIVSAILSMIIFLFAINGTDIMKPSNGIIEGINDIDKGSITVGYEGIARVLGGGLLALAAVAVIVYVLSRVFYIFLLILILQIVARIVQIGSEDKWKNTVSKWCSYISIALYVVVCLIFLVGLITRFLSYIILLPLILNIYCVVIFKRTLSKKQVLTSDTNNFIDDNNSLL